MSKMSVVFFSFVTHKLVEQKSLTVTVIFTVFSCVCVNKYWLLANQKTFLLFNCNNSVREENIIRFLCFLDSKCSNSNNKT